MFQKSYVFAMCLLFIIVVAGCSSHLTLDSTLAEINSLDQKYGVSWKMDLFVPNATGKDLESLGVELSERATSLAVQNESMLAAIMASRALMVNSQERFSRAGVYGEKGHAYVIRGGSLDFYSGLRPTVDCKNLEVYSRVADLVDEGLSLGSESNDAFQAALSLATPEEKAKLGRPNFYALDLRPVIAFSKDNRDGIALCTRIRD